MGAPNRDNLTTRRRPCPPTLPPRRASGVMTSALILAAIGVVPTLALTALVELAYFSRMADLMNSSARFVTAVTSALQFLGFGAACALVARAVEAQRTGRGPSLSHALRGLRTVAGSLVAVLLTSAVFVGALSAVAYPLGIAATLVLCLAPVAVAVDGGPAFTGFRRGANAVLKAPAATILVVGLTVLLQILLDMMRLAFSMTAAQFGHFSFGVQGAAAVISTVIVTCAGVALALIYRKASGR